MMPFRRGSTRPYTRRGKYGWGAGVAYTPSWAYAEGGDLFSFPTITTNFNGKHPISDDRLGVTADLFNVLDMHNLGVL